MTFQRFVFLVRRRLWQMREAVSVALWPRAAIARLEAAAEAAYDAMYYAERYSIRECYDDAFINLMHAIRIAERRGMRDIAERLKARQDHIYHVYDHQFRRGL
jgi:hypothetical protein